MSNNSTIVLGIDVAKLKLDVALIVEHKVLTKQFANSSAGFKSLQAWLESLSLKHVQACLEATGTRRRRRGSFSL
ncbi:MAG: transposase [Pyrinomonadaceae bacterium MAG19_C2-C3]|nr:transposase [Pyrinomonadaceae bacterium MAG19_C2-C3]